MHRIRKLIFLVTICLFILSGCKNESTNETADETNESTKPETSSVSMINPEGTTLEDRFLIPDGYKRTNADTGSLAAFIRNYSLKKDGSPVLLHNGKKKGNQSAHAAIFSLPMEDKDLQQCADSVMRMYAEYYWNAGEYDKIAFHFTNGFLCEYAKWRDGFSASNCGVYIYGRKYDEEVEILEELWPSL